MTMYQQWDNLFFYHFKVEPKIIKNILPKDISLDLFEGKAYLAIVGFEMSSIYFSPCSFLKHPGFFELNLRTYVLLEDGTPAVYFFTLDSNSFLSSFIANLFFKLPYTHRYIQYKIKSEKGDFRAHDKVNKDNFSFQISEIFIADKKSFFLLERYHFITEKKGQFYKGALSHAPYQVFYIQNPLYETSLFKRFLPKNTNVSLDPLSCYFSKGFQVKVLSFKKIKKIH